MEVRKGKPPAVAKGGEGEVRGRVPRGKGKLGRHVFRLLKPHPAAGRAHLSQPEAPLPQGEGLIDGEVLMPLCISIDGAVCVHIYGVKVPFCPKYTVDVPVH